MVSFTASTAVSLSFYTVSQPGEMVGIQRLVGMPPGVVEQFSLLVSERWYQAQGESDQIYPRGPGWHCSFCSRSHSVLIRGCCTATGLECFILSITSLRQVGLWFKVLPLFVKSKSMCQWELLYRCTNESFYSTGTQLFVDIISLSHSFSLIYKKQVGGDTVIIQHSRGEAPSGEGISQGSGISLSREGIH